MQLAPAISAANPPALSRRRRTHPVMKVLYLDHTARMGGGEIALLNLVTHLDPTACRPTVLLFSEGPLRRELTNAGIDVHVLELDPSVTNVRKDSLGASSLLRIRDLWRTIQFCHRLNRWIAARKFDLIHTNSLKADIIGGIAGRLAGVPVIWHVRDRISEDYLPPGAARMFRWLARKIPDRIITNSAATRRTLGKDGGRAASVVYSGTTSDGIQVVHDGTNMQDDLSDAVYNAESTIAIVGRIAPWKGQHIFLQAAALIVKRIPFVKFFIVGCPLFGEQKYEQELRQLCSSLNLDQHVVFTGFREDVSAFMAKMDVIVHASITGEPFGQVVIEAMAVGKPVVATNGGGIPEIVVHGKTGLLIPMNDAAAMAAAIASLIQDPALARNMGRLGRQRVQDHFTINHTARGVQDVYDSLLNR